MIDHRTEKTEITESRVIGRQRMSALVALTFLEVIQASDRPFEVFEEEDTSITMPRRLGLSDAVERRIRTYQKETRKGNKISDEEFADLVRFMIGNRYLNGEVVRLDGAIRMAPK